MARYSFTGHRPDKLGFDYGYKGPISRAIMNRLRLFLGNQKDVIKEINVGGAQGFDTMVALVCIELGIPFNLWIPFIGQEKMWPQDSQDLYNHIKNHPLCTAYIVCEGGYQAWKMQTRNETMVSRLSMTGDELIALWDGTPGGTANCIKYAKKMMVPVQIWDPGEIVN